MFITMKAPRLYELLSKNKIKDISREEFKEMCSLFNAFRTIARQYPNQKLGGSKNQKMDMDVKIPLIANGIYDYATKTGLNVGEVLYHILYNGPQETVVHRLYEALTDDDYHIINFRHSCLGELVGWGLPHIYPPRNDRTNKALKGLGYDVDVRNPNVNDE